MHYKFDNQIYKSENAARGNQQKQSDLVSHLGSFSGFENVLDYGCGKLRYFDELNTLSQSLFVLDSDIQLNRQQRIHGANTSIVQLSEESKKFKVLRIAEVPKYPDFFDFILLSNVLSAIPLIEERLAVLSNVHHLLSFKGKALIVLQYKDSYFAQYNSRPGAIRVNSGYWFKSGGQPRYYAMIGQQELLELVDQSSLVVSSIKRFKGRIFLTVCEN